MSKHLKLRLRHARARERRQGESRPGVGARALCRGRFGTGGRQVLTSGRREFALFTAIYLVYEGARWAGAGSLSTARAHAFRVISFERSLHIAIEGSVQRALDASVPSFLLAHVYLAAQAVVLPAALIWTYRRSPMIYRQLRGTVVIAWLIATPIFALYPVAPPRLAGIGLKDLVSHQAAVTLTGQSTLFYNPYAAIPSLHVGFAFAIGIASAAALRRPWTRAIAILWGPLVTLAVVATGNHYVLDGAAGLLVVAVAFAATRLLGGNHVRPQLSSRAAALRPLGAPVRAAQSIAPMAVAAAGPAAGPNADRVISAPAAARPKRPTIAVRGLTPDAAAGGCQA